VLSTKAIEKQERGKRQAVTSIVWIQFLPSLRA
jgi:hypothetical protein